MLAVSKILSIRTKSIGTYVDKLIKFGTFKSLG